MFPDPCLVVFDLDGTLIDSSRDLADSTNALVGSYGARPLGIDAILPMIGDGAKKLVERALAASGCDPYELDALDRFRALYMERLLIHTRPYEGIVDVVRAASVVASLAVLTNKPSDPTHRLLDAFALSPYFRWVIGGDDGVARKPDPAGLERVMAHAGVAIDRTLMIGDSMIDVETARHAGVAMCLASYGFGRSRGEIDLRPGESRVAHPRELTPVIAAFAKRLWPAS